MRRHTPGREDCAITASLPRELMEGFHDGYFGGRGKVCTYPQNEIIPECVFLASPVQDFIQNQNVCMVDMCVCVIVGDSNTKSSSSPQAGLG